MTGVTKTSQSTTEALAGKALANQITASCSTAGEGTTVGI